MRRATLPPTLLALLTLAWPSSASSGGWDGTRGVIYLSRGTYPAAMGWYRSEAGAHPDEAGPLAGLALAKCRVGRVEEAREHAGAAERLDPEDPLLLTARACLAVAAGEPEEALELHSAAADRGRLPFHRRELAWFLIHQGRFDEARQVIHGMEEAGWAGRNTLAMLAECGLGEGDLERAGPWIGAIQAEASGPRRAFHVDTLAVLADDLLQGPSAEPFPRKLSPFDASHDLVVMRAEVMRRLGRLDEAEREAGRRKREPIHPVCWAFLARIALDLGDPDRAEELLDEARERWPLYPSLLLSEALLAASRGDPDRAGRNLERARELGIPAWDVSVAGELETSLD